MILETGVWTLKIKKIKNQLTCGMQQKEKEKKCNHTLKILRILVKCKTASAVLLSLEIRILKYENIHSVASDGIG